MWIYGVPVQREEEAMVGCDGIFKSLSWSELNGLQLFTSVDSCSSLHSIWWPISREPVKQESHEKCQCAQLFSCYNLLTPALCVYLLKSVAVYRMASTLCICSPNCVLLLVAMSTTVAHGYCWGVWC